MFSITHRILSLPTLILIACLIVIIYMPLPAQTHPLTLQESDVANKHYCSTALFEAIRLICEGRTNSLSSKYPESFGNRRPSLLRRLVPDEEDVIFRPTSSGIAHECCRRPCGYSELHAYCED